MEDLKSKAQKILSKWNVDQKKREAREIELLAEKPEFWQDGAQAAHKMRRLSELQGQIGKLGRVEDWVISGETDSKGGPKEVEAIVSELEAQIYLSSPHDRADAILSIHAGQGGVDAMDWAEMLYRMYSKFALSRGWKLSEIDYEPGSEAGIKTVTFVVSGDFAYGSLKFEAGVHRLVRQSPFNADHLRQTSFALVEVLPDLEPDVAVQVRQEDLEWDFFRSGGHGGQNVNKVSSAVRLRHAPTGIIVSSQKERDQSRNREIALKVLKARILAIEEEKRRAQELALRGEHIIPGWGNQIRSYVLHPYHLVKDLRTNYEENNADEVLAGKLSGFIAEELHHFAGEK